MGAQITKQKLVGVEETDLEQKQQTEGTSFPGSNYRCPNRKEWMSTLPLETLKVRDLVWPGTHDSASNRIGIPLISRPFARCQKLSIYEQLVIGARVFDVRIQQDRKVCHGILTSYMVDEVLNDVKKFFSETTSEFVILEIRTEFQWNDPPNFDQWLVEQLGEYLIPQDESTFDKTFQELLPKRLFCVWKPNKSPAPSPGSPLWSSAYLKDNWIDTDLPFTKFNSNLSYLAQQAPNNTRNYFYRVENTATPQVSGPVVCVFPVTQRIRGYARLFLTEVFKRGIADRLQIFVEDFVQEDFIDACVGITVARYSPSLLAAAPATVGSATQASS
ncbi:unnamed protein product [Sphagnum compactum]